MRFELALNDTAKPNLAYGWQTPEKGVAWAIGRRSMLRLDLGPFAESEAIFFRMGFDPLVFAQVPFQRVGICVNGNALANVVLRERKLIEAYLSGEKLGAATTLFIEFDQPDFFRPSDYNDSPDSRYLSFGLNLLQIEAHPLEAQAKKQRLFDPVLGLHPDEIEAIRGLFVERLVPIAETFSRNDLSLETLLDAYVDGLCLETGGHTSLLQTRVDSLAREKNIISINESVFDKNGGIRSGLLPINIDVSPQYFYPKDEYTTFGNKILSKDSKYDEIMSRYIGYGNHIGFHNVDFSLYSVNNVDIIVDPFFYQVFNEDDNCYWPSAAPRPVSKSYIKRSKKRMIQCEIVIVQDLFYGDNFAHFLFDHITRIGHFIEANPSLKSDVVFVLGGAPTRFHSLLLECISTIYSLPSGVFFFPTHTEILRVVGRVHWFSDQVVHKAHPAQCAHPKSIELIKQIGRRLELPGESFRKVYISRLDAKARRPSNELKVAEALRELGFEILIMSKLSIEQQIRSVQDAEIIIAPHGMGLTFASLSRVQPAVIELHNNEVGSAAYAIMAQAMGFEYISFTYDSINELFDFEVDIVALLSACAAVGSLK